METGLTNRCWYQIPKLLNSPNYIQPPAQLADSQWDVVRFRINAFTRQEYPLPRPPYSTLTSIGEEQSICHVTHISWSPTGLARYRRSVLAVLTSNHVLSIWEPTNNPRVETNWKRALVFEQEHLRDLSNQNRPLQKEEQIRDCGSKCRAFAFSHPCHVSPSDVWGTSLLAISTDNDEVIIARLLSPYRHTLRRCNTWQLEILGRIRVDPSSNDSLNHLSTVKTPRATVDWKPKYATNLSWSPWTAIGVTRQTSVLAYIASEKLWFHNISVVKDKTASGASNKESPITVHIGQKISVFDLGSHSSVPHMSWYSEVWIQYICFTQLSEGDMLNYFRFAQTLWFSLYPRHKRSLSWRFARVRTSIVMVMSILLFPGPRHFLWIAGIL